NYKISCNSVAPNDSSAQELAAIKANKGTSKGPDVVDISPAIAVVGQNQFQPYKVQTWSQIPNSMKDPAGRWYGDYYGVISFGTNTEVVPNPPKSWADLQKSETQVTEADFVEHTQFFREPGNVGEEPERFANREVQDFVNVLAFVVDFKH